MINNLLELDVLVEMKKAAPVVTAVPFDVAKAVVGTLDRFAEQNDANTDQYGATYWQTTVKALHKMGPFDPGTISLNIVGRTLRQLGLESWRKADGFHVAWSQKQLDILKRYFLD